MYPVSNNNSSKEGDLDISCTACAFKSTGFVVDTAVVAAGVVAIVLLQRCVSFWLNMLLSKISPSNWSRNQSPLISKEQFRKNHIESFSNSRMEYVFGTNIILFDGIF